MKTIEVFLIFFCQIDFTFTFYLNHTKTAFILKAHESHNNTMLWISQLITKHLLTALTSHAIIKARMSTSTLAVFRPYTVCNSTAKTLKYKVSKS